MRRILVLALLAMLVAAASAQKVEYHGNPSKVIGSMHDFSATSPAQTKATDASPGVCTFCHTPHKANPSVPLWNHALSKGFTYTQYSSSTLTSTVNPPGDADSSKLCLSCHDGTVALGDTVNNGQIPFQNTTAQGMMLPTARGNLGVNLADDHPVAFVANQANNQVQAPPQGDAVHLDGQQKLQCSSCHDPHEQTIDPVEERFLVKSNSSAAICTTCHKLNGGSGGNLWSWDGTSGLASSHQSAVNSYTAATNAGVSYLGSHTGYNTVATNGCEACHRPHTAHNAERLLKDEVSNVCMQCHDGNTTTNLKDLGAEFKRSYAHPSIGPQAGHDPAEDPTRITTRHASCDDCHNAHADRVRTGVVVPPQLSPELLGVSGITRLGAAHDPRHGSGDAEFEYEVCFKCHGANSNQPQQSAAYATYGQQPNRAIPSVNLILAFSSPASYHPVAQPGLSGNVPSLLPKMLDGAGNPIDSRLLTTGSQIFCTDCHNNSQGSNLGAGNLKPAGPHGSDYQHLLERQYLIEQPTAAAGDTADIGYTSSNYALCFKCHSETGLQGPLSWRGHTAHMARASCATCHDAHGVPNGTNTANSGLINFDLNIVRGLVVGTPPTYTRTAPLNGTCSLRCHSVDHSALTY